MLINLETLIHIIHINLSQLVDFLGQIFDDLDRTERKKKKDKKTKTWTTQWKREIVEDKIKSPESHAHAMCPLH